MAKPVGDRQDLEWWRLKKTRFRVTQPFKVGWLHLPRKMALLAEEWGTGTPEQMLPFRVTHSALDQRRVQKAPPTPFKHLTFKATLTPQATLAQVTRSLRSSHLSKHPRGRGGGGYQEGGGTGAPLPVPAGD